MMILFRTVFLSTAFDHVRFGLKTRFSGSARVTASEIFFGDENRNRIIQRLQNNTNPSIAENRRAVYGNSTKYANLRQAAVLVPLMDVKGIVSILFTVRSSHLSMHRGEVSFPGGRADDADGGSAEKTALREAQEEIGIDPRNVELWGRLPPTLSRSGDTLISPVIGAILDFDPFAFPKHGQPHSAEVRTVFARDLESLTDSDYLSFTQFRAGYSMPVFNCGAFRIWGLTAIILHNALKVLVPELYRPATRYVRPFAC